MKFKTYYFQFNAPLHLGNHQPDSYEKSEKTLHSDTITAAILSMWARMGQKNWIGETEGDPGFTISSAFPYTTIEGDKVHFFPRPMVLWNRKFNPDLSKKIKKISWLDQDYFETLLAGESMEYLGKNNKALRGAYLTSQSITTPLYHSELQQRVVVSRTLEEDARPFVMERLHFTQGSGLYIMILGEDERLKSALELLQYEGFGTDRSVGNGSFDLAEGEIELNTPSDTLFSTNIGLYLPEDRITLTDQLSDSHTAYSLIKRGGWITTEEHQGLEKNAVHMFSEGSIFKANTTISGNCNIDLRPETSQVSHPIYRSGRSIFLPIRLTND